MMKNRFVLYKANIHMDICNYNPEQIYNIQVSDIAKHIQDGDIVAHYYLQDMGKELEPQDARLIFYNMLAILNFTIRVNSVANLYNKIYFTTYMLYDLQEEKTMAFAAKELIENKEGQDARIYWCG